MPMTLLDNELIRKYFWPKCPDDPCYLMHNHDTIAAFNVYAAMQEPIRKGDRCLENFPSMPCWREIVWQNPTEFEAEWHPGFLRLPDAFQPQAEKCCCGESDSVHRTDGPCYKIQKPDPVEEKIQELGNTLRVTTDIGTFKTALYELVALTRGSK